MCGLQVPKLTEQIKDVACGQSHTCAIAYNGPLYTFGAGWFGRLGQGAQPLPQPSLLAGNLLVTTEIRLAPLFITESFIFFSVRFFMKL